jgi:hypothetical protein
VKAGYGCQHPNIIGRKFFELHVNGDNKTVPKKLSQNFTNCVISEKTSLFSA